MDKLEKFKEIVGILDKDTASNEEVAEAFGMVFQVLEALKEKMSQEMEGMDAEMRAKHEKMMAEMEKMKSDMEESMKKGDMKAMKECEKCMAKMEEMKKDIEKMQEEMPAMPDLIPLEKRMGEMEKKEMPKIPENLVKKDELLAEVETLKEELKKEIDEVRKLPRGGGGISSLAVRQAFKYIFHTEAPTGAINGVNTTYTVQNSIWAIIGFTLNGESIAELPNYTYANRTITFSSAIPAAYSGKDFEIKYIG